MQRSSSIGISTVVRKQETSKNTRTSAIANASRVWKQSIIG